MSPPIKTFGGYTERFPRPRGDEPVVDGFAGLGVEVFPARAGMSPASSHSPTDSTGFPRPRGDEPGIVQLLIRVMEFSPPARG